MLAMVRKLTRTLARKSAANSSRRSQRKTAPRKSTRSGSRGRRWSARVTRESDALDLERGVFTKRDPKRIAASLKRSAERSRRRKTLQRAKGELRKQFGRD